MVQERDILRRPWFIVLINGKEIPKIQHNKIKEVKFEDNDEELDAATITIVDNTYYAGGYPEQMYFLNNPEFVKGAKVMIGMGHGNNHRVVMDEGIISVIEPSFGEDGVVTINITVINGAVSMTDERKTRKFEKMKISDVVFQVTQEMGWYCVIEDTGTVLEQITQNDETDLEFINRLASIVGYKFHAVNEGNYYFGSDQTAGSTVASLYYFCGDTSIISASISWVKQEDSSSVDSDIDAGSGETETKEASPEMNQDLQGGIQKADTVAGVNGDEVVGDVEVQVP